MGLARDAPRPLFFSLGAIVRKITSHRVGGLNEDLAIHVLDEPGSGGACHQYTIGCCLNPGTDEGGVNFMCDINFQNGPLKEAGINGISNEALLAIVIDRLQGFQSGQYASRENAIALTKAQESLHWLQHRTRERLERGVEGTHAK
jgi:hypothetical protein